MMSVSRLSFGTVLVALSGLVGAQPAIGQDMESAVIETREIAGNVYALFGPGGNIGVSVGDDGMLIVDDLMAPLTERIREALGKLGEGKVKFLLNTHWHPDHTGANQDWGGSAPIVAHHNVRHRLATQQEVLGMTYGPLPAEGLPVVTFADSLSIHFNGEEIRAIHLPGGHTDGDIVVWFSQSNVVHMGDLFFNGMFPFIDFGSGGDVLQFTENVGAVLDRIPDDVRIIPGHGPVGDIEDLRRFHTMLSETTAIVRGHVEAGKTLEEIQAEETFVDYPGWGDAFITAPQWSAMIHASLTREDA
jgi:glyoxylase-like metal-dependent hydrolase (beta-lactamase superfamily II)